VEQIQNLFERVYLEKIHVREARLKQLQSQINPHFFYNCFSFISSMAKLKDTQAVIAMSQNLASYYRYTTRQEKDMATLAEEIDFIRNYLEIHKLRKKRLDYVIEIPQVMNNLLIPRLLIQPLVENAVVHGVEAKAGAGLIRITGYRNGSLVCIAVEDNGKGMSEGEIVSLQQRLMQPMDEEMGCGLWNIHQRVMLRYGEQAKLRLTRSELGGLKVSLMWHEEEQDQLAEEALIDDRSLTG
jgi:two-component system sensor histidine kinase YesM